MKKILILFVIIFLLAGCSSQDDMVIISNPRLGKVEEIIVMGEVTRDDSYDVYRAVRTDADLEKISMLAQKLGIEENLKKDESGNYYGSSDKGSIILNASTGSMAYSSAYEIRGEDIPVLEKRSDSEYIDIAVSFLESNEIEFANLSYESANVYPAEIETLADGSNEKIITYGVNFRHKKINGTEVTGDGPKVDIYINGSGDVVSMLSDWRIFQQWKKLEIIETDEAVTRALSGEATIIGLASTGIMKAEKVDIVYFGNQEFLVPYYRFDCITEDGEDAALYVCALKDGEYSYSK